jgi:hypothetical protein
MPGKVFISYRREDSAGHAGRLHDRLLQEFGDIIFMDVDGIPLGVDFVERLTKEVASCDVLLAMIGPRWINVRDRRKKRRLDNPRDFVRVEIATALQREIPVIPILLEGTEMPGDDLLPADLKPLAVRNGLSVDHSSFHADLARLVRELKQLVSVDRTTKKPDRDDLENQLPISAAAGEKIFKRHMVVEYFISCDRSGEHVAEVEWQCSQAEKRGKAIFRGNDTRESADRLSIFMNSIGRGVSNGYVCIVLSNTYLTSPYCMQELFIVWRNCREDPNKFVDRTRVFVLPSVGIKTPIGRGKYADYWQGEFKKLEALVREHRELDISDKDYTELRLMSRFVSETCNILHFVQDVLRPRSFADYAYQMFD